MSLTSYLLLGCILGLFMLLFGKLYQKNGVVLMGLALLVIALVVILFLNFILIPSM